jgi:hypothetical protein
MSGDQVFWLLRGAQFLPLDADGPGRSRQDIPHRDPSASAQDARRSTRRRIASFLWRS